jgi:8-oxo-dGTP pyrophosphatase MutT (NUDIX family)
MTEKDEASRTLESSGKTEEPSSDSLRRWILEAQKLKKHIHPRGSSAVLIPILIRDGEYHVLYEVRSSKLRTQPGEVCFPGGRIETGESPLSAAIRETTEELCIRSDQIEIVGELENTVGPGGIPFYSFVGVLHDYEGTWSEAEVDQIFTLPLKWIMSHEPDVYDVKLENRIPEDFPFELIPGGRAYNWRNRSYQVPFYQGTDGTEGKHPVLWGMTARVTLSLAKLLCLTEKGGDQPAGEK